MTVDKRRPNTCVKTLIGTDFSFRMPWHCEISLILFCRGSDTPISLEFIFTSRNPQIWNGCYTDLFLLIKNQGN